LKKSTGDRMLCDMTDSDRPDYLLEQVDQYCKTMIAIKKLAVATKKGPTDIPSLLVIRYGANSDSKAGELARMNDEGNIVLHDEDGVVLCERLVNLTEFAGDGVAPGTRVYQALMQFIDEYEGASPWTVSVVADGVAMTDPDNAEWKQLRSLPENKERGLHELFCEEPRAQKWLSECINVFLMDLHGNMASTVCRYVYGDDTHPPVPIFEPSEVKYEGKVFERDREWIQSQRVLAQMLLFYASVEASMEEGDDSHE